MPKLDDATYAENARRRTRESAQRLRERYQAQGLAPLTLWITATVREALREEAREKGQTLNDLVAQVLAGHTQKREPPRV